VEKGLQVERGVAERNPDKVWIAGFRLQVERGEAERDPDEVGITGFTCWTVFGGDF
jgi:hypothetical protein